MQLFVSLSVFVKCYANHIIGQTMTTYINKIKRAWRAISMLSILVFAFMAAFSFEGKSDDNSIDMKAAEKLYKAHCSKCHRNNGTGIKKVYPPLKNADYIKNSNAHELLRGMLFGRSGKVTVNGVTYNGVMTTEIDGNLKDADIALILSYTYQKFNNMNIKVSEAQVQKARKAGKLPAHK